MWIFKGKILDFLSDEKVDLSKKEDAFSKNKKKVIKEVGKLTDVELINLLLNKKTIDPVREVVRDYISSLSNKTDDESTTRYNSITNQFIKRYGKNTGLITNEFCPVEYRKKIIDLSFGNDLVSVIEGKSISFKKKCAIIDLKLSGIQAIGLLKRNNISKDLREYLIDRRINTQKEIEDVLKDSDISDDVKEYVGVTKVNMSNIFSIIRLSFHGEKELLYRVKARELDDYILGLDYSNVFEFFINYDAPSDFIKRIVDERGDAILDGVRRSSKEVIKKVLNYERDFSVVELILRERYDTVIEIVNELEEYQLLSFLNRKFIPEDVKKYAIERHASLLDKVIKKESVNHMDFYYLNKDSHMPLEIKKRLFSEHKEEFKEKYLAYSDKEVIDKIKYGSLDKILLEYMIKLRINEDNIFLLLSERHVDEAVVNLVFSIKGDIIDKFIYTIDVDNLYTLNNINVPDEMKNRIIGEHSGVVVEILRGVDHDTLFEKVINSSVLLSVRKAILEVFGIVEDDVKNCLLLMDSSKIKMLIDNYSIIKSFIEKSGISFESFLQYGSGSKKHANWVNNIIEIYDDEDFIRCKDYFFNYYYDEDNEKENAVYTISNYLEFLDNYCKYKKLFLYLCDNRTDLSRSDKDNLGFLFSVKDIRDSMIPEDLVDLELVKEYVFESYKERIENGTLNYYEMKSIFNDLLFSGSKEILENIGGSGALRTLKKDNSNSKYIGSLVDEVMLYSRLIEMVNDSTNEESIKKLLEYVFSDLEVFTKMQNLFRSCDKKILRLYEEDSINNLTRLDRVRDVDGVLREDLCKLYGGEVYDFSDKNYCLYGHVFSPRENIDEVLSGKSTGSSNFISVSPISYRGQKFYWDRSEVIFAYDRIPKGSFICSSIHNMGTNSKLNNNTSEVGEWSRSQRGILETSAVVQNNAETLLYREGLRPCGLILPGGREPSKKELEYHKKYNLPFIITQEVMKPIEEVKFVFDREDSGKVFRGNTKDVKSLVDALSPSVVVNKESDIYTGKEVALISDCHSMYEPTLAALEDIRRHGIDEIYSLGDNVGGGANPCEVFDLLEEYGVVSVSGNSEYYNHLGTEPFSYLGSDRQKETTWTERKLGIGRINKLKMYPPSIDLFMGDKKLALCHFGNDVRWDYGENGTYAYQQKQLNGHGGAQFLYTNSDEARRKISNCISSSKKNDPKVRGYVSSKDSPLFDGKRVTDYDTIIQGHVHFDMKDKVDDTDIITIRAVGMGYGSDAPNTACYYVLRERKDGGVDIEKRLVPFNKNNLLASFRSSDVPNKEHMLQYLHTDKDAYY